MGILTSKKNTKTYKDKKNKIVKRSGYYFDYDNRRTISFEDGYPISKPKNIILRHATQKI